MTEIQETKVPEVKFKYAMIINGNTGELLLSDCYKEIGDVKKESTRIMQKILDTKLNPSERKKITSKRLGKWLSMSDDNLMIGCVCVEDEYPERLAYKMIMDCSQKLIEKYGEDDYINQTPQSIKAAFGDDFKGLIKKYNNPNSFDKLSSANAKVDLAKEKMAANLQQAMENSAALEGLNSKTADLLNMAKDFSKDADELHQLMAQRAMRMRVITYTIAIGGGGTVGVPIILSFL
jgi:hypothetical protein